MKTVSMRACFFLRSGQLSQIHLRADHGSLISYFYNKIIVPKSFLVQFCPKKYFENDLGLSHTRLMFSRVGKWARNVFDCHPGGSHGQPDGLC